MRVNTGFQVHAQPGASSQIGIFILLLRLMWLLTKPIIIQKKIEIGALASEFAQDLGLCGFGRLLLRLWLQLRLRLVLRLVLELRLGLGVGLQLRPSHLLRFFLRLRLWLLFVLRLLLLLQLKHGLKLGLLSLGLQLHHLL